MTKTNADPLNVNARLYKQISKLLEDLENPPIVRKGKKGESDEVEAITLRERIAAMTAIARIQTVFMSLRAEEQPDERNSGSAVRKYTAAFKNAGGRRAKGAGPAAAAKPVAIDDLDRDDPDDIA